MAGQALLPWRSQSKRPQAPKLPWRSHKHPPNSDCPSSSAAMDDYDVFLNHRGPDVKGGFVAHLHEALRSAGLNSFLDKKCLVMGDHAFESIDAALEGAQVHVAVVSKGYADSKHCLRELAVIMRSGKPVIPVFYDVEPGNLRRVDAGLFAAAFEKHKSRESVEEVEEWADALGKLADITGICFRLSDYNGDEVELKNKVVDSILNMMPTYGYLQLDCNLIGVEDRLNTCIRKVEEMCIGTSVLGLVGMGGVGKTTLAKMIYNYFVGSKKFQAMRFLEIDQMSPLSTKVGTSLLNNLQNPLLWDTLHVRESSHQWYRYLFGQLLRQGRSLVVLDDIQDKNQIDWLIHDISLLAPGSCIIVTSRDRHILNSIGARALNYYVYEVTPLDCSDSEKLFNLYAFKNEEALEDFKASASDVAKACNGLPLALKVVGSSLCDKKSTEDLEHIWPEAIDAIHKDLDIESTLKWSYDCLSKSEKLMFLDIACVFYGWRKEEVLEIWKGCKDCVSCCGCETPHTSLRKLSDKSLITIQSLNGHDRIFMHGLLQDMGQQIGKDNGSHLLDNRGVRAIKGKSQEPNKIRALSLVNNTKCKFEAESFANLTNLHYLILDGCDVSGKFGGFFKELRYLRWRNMAATHVPPMLDLSNLVSLDFSDSTRLANLLTESNPALEACPNLLRLNLSQCTSIITLPDSLGRLSRLQVLSLIKCKNLQELPNSIGQLTGLEELNLAWCGSLEALPDSITALSRLQTLHMGECSSILKVPTSIGLLHSLCLVTMNLTTECQVIAIGQSNALKTLGVWECNGEAVTMLDNSGALRNLTQLQGFWFYGCPSMTKLPQTMGLLTNLEKLTLYACERVEELPNSIGQLKVLRTLSLIKCKSLVTLPNSLGALRGLETLWIVGCTSMIELPTSIVHLSNLCTLLIQDCGRLQSFPNSLRLLNALYYLSIIDCGRLEGLGLLGALQGLRIWGCTFITELPGSCLMVVDSDVCDPAFTFTGKEGYRGEVEKRNVKESEEVQVNDCGFLRIVHDGTRSILQRVYESPCGKC